MEGGDSGSALITVCRRGGDGGRKERERGKERVSEKERGKERVSEKERERGVRDDYVKRSRTEWSGVQSVVEREQRKDMRDRTEMGGKRV